MATKSLVGHHLMRVRIKKGIFERLQDLADESTILSGEHVTVSDLVRTACVNYLQVHEQLRQLQSGIAEGQVEDVLIVAMPMLRERAEAPPAPAFQPSSPKAKKKP